ncbi:Copia-like retrotransposable element [Dorcoceras hygrometricum]|uniref:Copia-like retrotransposable element n=1 Tax=Dorcoceras hygrometricum TaxID=472368 RepID=A0A2Z7B5T3_9LAMI|nr:Copia-like retrotransposable element [Dorcoceras hygrometricum]
MASSYYTNTFHVNFASVLSMDDPGMVSMFHALMASGLEGFLGCPAVIYEASLVEFFANASVRDGMVVSTVHGVTVEISEQLFAETFELPLEGLSELSEIPKDLVFDTRSIVSLSGEPVSTSGKKKEMKFEYHLLCDIMEKKISINWNRVLFNILKDMVTAGSRQAKGYAIQISLLLENITNLELGESSEFPSSKILTDNTVHRYIVLNENIGAEVVATAPQEAVPIQIIEPIPAAPVVEPSMEEQREATSAVPIDDDISAVEQPAAVEPIFEEFDEPAVEVAAEEIRPPSTDDVDNIIEQVLDETSHIEADEETAGTADDSVPCDTEDEEMETIDVGDQQLQTVDAAVSRADAAADYFVEEPVEETETETGELSADEAKSIEDILMTIPVDVPLPSAGVEITKITLGKDIKIPGVDERTWYLANLPMLKPEEKGKKPLHEKDPVKGNQVEEQILLILADIECLVHLREKIIDDVDRFFNSFSFMKLSSLKVEDISAKEELFLSWGQAESTRVALNRRM